jgi:hypothetical protein
MYQLFHPIMLPPAAGLTLVDVTSTKVSPGGGAGSTVTLAHTCKTGVNLLLVEIGIDDSNQNAHQITTVTYNGVAMTQIVKADTGSGNEQRSEIWGLLNPTTGSSQNILVSYDFLNYISVGATSYSGADTVLPSITNTVTNLTGASPSMSLTSTRNGAIIHDIVTSQSVQVVNGGQRIAWQNQGQSFQNTGSSVKVVSVAGSSTIGYTNTGGNGVAYAAVVVQPPASGGGGASISRLALLGIG